MSVGASPRVSADSEALVTASVPEASNGSGKARFPRSVRLLRHADFERVYKQGKRHFSPLLTAFFVPRAEGLRVGFTVGRVLGGAVQRNRMKRRLREAVRLTRPVVGADVVINPRKSLLDADFEAVLNEVKRAFVVVEKKVGAAGPGSER